MFEVKKTKHDLRAQPPRRSCFFHALPDSVFLPHRPHLSHHISTQLTSSPYSRLSFHIIFRASQLHYSCHVQAGPIFHLTSIYTFHKNPHRCRYSLCELPHRSLLSSFGTHALLALRATAQAHISLKHIRAAKIPVQAPCRILRRPSLHAKSSTYCDNLSFYHKGVGLVLVLCTFSDQSYAKTKNLINCRIYTINYSFIHFLPQKSVKIKRVETCIYMFLHAYLFFSNRGFKYFSSNLFLASWACSFVAKPVSK